ncbi:MAG: hypothetical protein MI741_11430, partial [Rhodospirillales bacterium]|nr:hypothetical protein [Rhodospirillales bacterium]
IELDQSEQVARFGRADGGNLLLPGAFVRGSVRSQSEEPRWLLPRRAIRGGRIFLAKEGVIISRQVDVAFMLDQSMPQFGVTDQQWAVLAASPGPGESSNNGDNANTADASQRAPLNPGELVVLNVTSTLTDGDRIEPVVLNQDAAPEAATTTQAREDASP